MDTNHEHREAHILDPSDGSTAATQSSAQSRAFSDVRRALRSAEQAIGVAGLSGSARAWFASRLVHEGNRPLILVVPSDDVAEGLERDLRFFLGVQQGETTRVLRLPADDILPYDDLSPDRQITQQRLRALFHLQAGTRFDVLVLSARALARRVLPRDTLDGKSLVLRVDEDQPIDELAQALAEAGFENVPLVEDPGTFAIRGGIVDVFSPLHDNPARLEFFGDTIESIRFFDPATQRTVHEAEEVAISPAREVVFDDETKAAVTNTIRTAADEVSRPSSKVRELIEEVNEGIAGFGVEALLPGFFPQGLDPVTAFLPDDALVLVDDPYEIQRTLDQLDEDLASDFEAARDRGELSLPPEAHFLTADETLNFLASRRRIELQTLILGGLLPSSSGAGDTSEDEDDEDLPEALRRASGNGVGAAPTVTRFHFGETADIRRDILAHRGESGALDPLVARLSDWRDREIAGVVACSSAGQAEKLRRMLLDRDVMAKVVSGPLPESPGDLYEPSVYAHIVLGDVTSGFVDPAHGFGLVADQDIFGERTRRRVRKPRSEQPFTAAFRDIKEGDLVVHVEHGIARYEGLTKLRTGGWESDFLILQFAGKDKLYLPVHRLRQIQKYVGGDPEKVRLDSLKSSAFASRKKRVKEELLRMAAELLDIYAARKAHPGTAFNEPDELYRQFESEFEFEETPDQEKAINDVLSDMTGPSPMDRLICGDVGYGKTEVALRAAFKAVEDRKQVAVLVPTTVLAAQHFHTFTSRLANYPINVEMISRFRDAKQIRDILKRTAEGKIDILIGTHRLLSADVSFKDLGLLVIDEEQRFGVKHKETLKRYRKLVDVLTLTATPIPRTLHMSLMGVRDMSIIATPPADRRAVRTFVVKFDKEVIKEAIEREMARGGQVFFLHNRVESIEGLRRYVQELVPKARIGIAHGQMAEGRLEQVMTEFVEKKFDVLICTTIIESGLDIPSANTMLVSRADMFGLAQLYQIRGRVGRSRERAYCYLFIPARRPITKDARKRLQVLQQFTELGAGFHVASHDLEIRGAGNLLGPTQSGTIAAVGFDLYTELMEEAVRELKGEPPKNEIEPDVNLPIPAFIPEEYIPEVGQRLLFYKRLAQASNADELYDVRTELADRYGELPGEVDNLCQVMTVKADMRRLNLRAMDAGPNRLVVTLGAEAKLDPVRVAQLVAGSREGMRLTPEMKLVYPIGGKGDPTDILDGAHRMMRVLLDLKTETDG